MARFKMTFISSERSEHKQELECYANRFNEIYLEISNEEDLDHEKRYVCLDISTAIKFAKTLRTEINIAKEVCDE